MKKLALLITLLVAQISFAQVNKEIGSFKKPSVFDQIQVTLIPTTGTPKIEIEGKKQDNVNVINKNEHLKIKMTFVKSYQGEDIKIKLYYKDLTEINAGEGSIILNNETLKADELSLQGKTGSSIKLNIKADKVKIKAGAGSLIKLTGTANVQDALSNSGADILNSNLDTKQTDVTVNAGGKASVKASEVVDAKVRAGGTISVYGNPKKLNETTVAGGTIKKVD